MSLTGTFIATCSGDMSALLCSTILDH